MELSVSQVLSYINCPIRYALEYNARIKPEDDSLHEQWAQAMHTAVSLLVSAHGRQEITEQEMLDKWESL